MTIEDWTNVPAIPAFPNWSTALSERYEFRTRVFEADTGDEQRGALRQRPRRSIQYLTTPYRETLRELELLLTLRRDTKIKVPDVTRSVPVTVVAPSAVTIDEGLTAWMAAGSEVFFQQGRNYHKYTIDHVSGSTLSIVETIDPVYSTPRMSPARFCRFAQQQKISRPTSEVAQATLLLDIDPGTEEDHEASAPLQFRGQDTLFLKPNWRDGVGITFGVPGDLIDYGVGQIAIDYRQALNTKVMEFAFLARDRLEVQQHLDLFYRCKGRRGVFYVPTWTTDFEVVSIDYGANTLTVRGVYRQDLDPFDFTHRNLAMIWGDTVVPFGIYSAVPSSEGLVLKVDRVLTSLPLPSRFFLSWLVMGRFASDELTVDWRSDTVAEISYNVAVVRDGFYELAIGGHRIVFGGDYVLMGNT